MNCNKSWPISSYTALYYDWGARRLRNVQNQAGRAMFDQLSGASIRDMQDGKCVNLYDQDSQGATYEFCHECTDRKRGGDGTKYLHNHKKPRNSHSRTLPELSAEWKKMSKVSKFGYSKKEQTREHAINWHEIRDRLYKQKDELTQD